MTAMPNEGPADPAAETGGHGEVLLPLGGPMPTEVDHDLLRWLMASDTVVQRARRFNAMLRDRVGVLLDEEDGAATL